MTLHKIYQQNYLVNIDFDGSIFRHGYSVFMFIWVIVIPGELVLLYIIY